MPELRSLVQRAKSIFRRQRSELLEKEDAVSAGLSDHCVLLGGQPRSGTSLLTSILRTSPELFQAYEVHIRKPSFLVGNDGRYTRRIFEQLGLPPEEFDRIAAEADRGAMNLGAWCGPKEEVSAEPLSGAETDRFVQELTARGELATRLMRTVAAMHGRERWGFKILGDVIHADTYAEVWPEATMILLVRDPRDHALSVMKLNKQREARGQPNFYDDYPSVARGWCETIGEGLEAIRSSGLRYLVVRYEDLIGDTDNELQRLSDKLDIDLSRGREFHKADFIAVHTSRFKHHDNLKRPINSESLEKWRSQMSDADVGIFSEIAGALMQQYGYSIR